MKSIEGVEKILCFLSIFLYVYLYENYLDRFMKYRIIIEQDEDGVFVIECPALPGCVSQGYTRDEAIKNIQDAIKGYILSLKKDQEPIPPTVEEEIIEVSIG